VSLGLTRAEFSARLADPERLALASPTASDDAEARMASGAPLRDAAVLVPIATTRLYDTLQVCTVDYVCARPPAEWIVICALTGVTACRLIREAERAKRALLWIGALPPVITTAFAINWYLPAGLGGLPIAGALISIGGLLLLRRATMAPAPLSRRASRGR
jgi:hypothetical protein